MDMWRITRSIHSLNICQGEPSTPVYRHIREIFLYRKNVIFFLSDYKPDFVIRSDFRSVANMKIGHNIWNKLSHRT